MVPKIVFTMGVDDKKMTKVAETDETKIKKAGPTQYLNETVSFKFKGGHKVLMTSYDK